MRLPRAVATTLRTQNEHNLPDSAAVQTATIGAYTAGTTTRPVTWATVATEPCRCVPIQTPKDAEPQREAPVIRFEVSFRHDFVPLTTQRLVVTSAEGWTKTLAIETVLTGYTDDVRTVAYCKALP